MEAFMTDTGSAGPILERHLTPQDLALREGIPVQTVYGWRVYGKGPRGMRVGKHLRYRLEDVLAWEESQLEPREATA
jgi:hypothetical protein